jgi:hypothetical protein
MKIFIPVALSTFFILSACLGGNSKLKNKPKFDYGKVVNNIYSNSFLGLEVSLPETWAADTSKKYNSTFSPHFLEADLFDENQNALISLNIVGHKKNPFSSDETLLQYLKDSNENLGMLYEKDEHREFIKEIKIAESDFFRNRVLLLEESQILFMDEYATERNGYFYSMTFSYTDTLNRASIDDILAKVKIK